MSREIKFRGIGVDNREWAYGYYYEYTPGSFIRVSQDDGGFEDFKVIPESVGEYTGENDKDDVEIYEDDICGYYNHYRKQEQKGKVRYMLGGWWFWRDGHIQSFHALFSGRFPLVPNLTSNDFAIIGNIHDNPELLKT